MIEQWLSLKLTLDFVQTVTGSSLGPACQTLISICESGDVHARWTDYFGDHGITRCPPIHKRDWIGADIDWSTFRVGKADGRRMAGVDFSVNDLHAWADARALAAALDVCRMAQLAAIEATAVPVEAAATAEPVDPEEAAIALIVSGCGLTKPEIFARIRRTGIGESACDALWRKHASPQQKAQGRRKQSRARAPAE